MAATSETSFSANEEYFRARKETLEQRELEKGVTVYPHKFSADHTVKDLLVKYHGLEAGCRLEDTQVAVAGRITAWRDQSKKLMFLDLRNDGYDVQIWISEASYAGDFGGISTYLRKNDIVGVRGCPARTKRGELSVFACEVVLLSPCLRMVPPSLTDPDTRFRKRHLDWIVNHGELRRILSARSGVIRHIRDFFNDRGFMEVETSMLHSVVGGAAARPFYTEVNATKETVGLRISPELALKEMVVGGFEKVFEIGRQFRNEGLDTTHNPTFTSIESYEAYADYYDLIEMTQELLAGLALKIKKSHRFTVVPLEGGGASKPIEIDFTPPFRQVPMIETLEELLEVTFPRPLDSDECNEFLVELCAKRGVKATPPLTTSRLLDTLVGEYIEPTCVNPTFITEHPQIMSPLAKYHRSKPELTERFELFICGKEFCNAYTELNNPHKQRECFRDQLKDRQKGDDEAQLVDWNFVDALDHGLPPTGGWGMGIDRLVMLFTGQTNIKEVLAFPMMKKSAN